MAEVRYDDIDKDILLHGWGAALNSPKTEGFVVSIVLNLVNKVVEALGFAHRYDSVDEFFAKNRRNISLSMQSPNRRSPIDLRKMVLKNSECRIRR